MIEELEDVVLECDLPEHNLKQGDIGTVMLIHRGGEGYEVEFTTLDGETVAVMTLLANQRCRKRVGSLFRTAEPTRGK